MALSVRLFGLQLVEHPRAAGPRWAWRTVGVLYATVRRTTASAGAGLLAGAVLALTPVAALMFRFNNPDALLVLLLIGAAYATLRGLEDGPAPRWLVLAGALVGFGVPHQDAAGVPRRCPRFALASTSLAARDPVAPRIRHLLVAVRRDGRRRRAGGSRSSSSWPAVARGRTSAARRTTASSSSPSATTASAGSPATRPAASAAAVGGGWGETGLGCGCSTPRSAARSPGCSRPRWCSLAVGWPAGCAPRTAQRCRRRCTALAAAGCWSPASTFSFMAGHLPRVLHGRAGSGDRRRGRDRRRVAVAAARRRTSPRRCSLRPRAFTAAWAFVAARPPPTGLPWLRYASSLIGSRRRPRCSSWSGTCRAGSARPSPRRRCSPPWPARGVLPRDRRHPAHRLDPDAGPSRRRAASAAGRAAPAVGRAAPPPGRRAGVGGLLNGSTSTRRPDRAAAARTPTRTPGCAAAVGSNTAAGYQLASELPVMAIGGFNGSDPSPTLAQFQEYVADGRDPLLHRVGGGMGGGGGGGGRRPAGDSSRSPTWVAARPSPPRPSTASPSTTSRPASSESPSAGRSSRPPLLEVVVPVHNEEVALAACGAPRCTPPRTCPWTWPDHDRRQRQHRRHPAGGAPAGPRGPGVRVVPLAEKGRGRALKRVWSASDADGRSSTWTSTSPPTSTR